MDQTQPPRRSQRLASEARDVVKPDRITKQRKQKFAKPRLQYRPPKKKKTSFSKQKIEAGGNAVDRPLPSDQLMAGQRPREKHAKSRKHGHFGWILDIAPGPPAQELIRLSDELKETKKNLEEKTQEARDLKDKLERETTKLTLDNGALTQKVEDLRDFMFSSSGEGRWSPEDDSDIRLSVGHLQKALKRWAKARCHKSVLNDKHHLLWHSANREMMMMIRQVAYFQTFRSVLRSNVMYLVVAALLSEFIRTHILAKPFFHIKSATPGNADDGFAVKATQIFEMLESDDPEAAISWRAQTIRSVFPDPGQSSTICAIHARVPIYPKGTEPAEVCSWYRKLAADFLRGPWSKILNKNLSATEVVQSNEHLYELMVMAGNIHFCLLTQKTKLVWAQPNPYIGQPFSVYSSLYKPESALCVDGEDESHQGKVVQIVFGTSLVGYGDSRGRNLQHRRIIVGASVSLDQNRPAVPLDSQQEPAIVGGSNPTFWPYQYGFLPTIERCPTPALPRRHDLRCTTTPSRYSEIGAR